jgi:hypothetical protein
VPEEVDLDLLLRCLEHSTLPETVQTVVDSLVGAEAQHGTSDQRARADPTT